ncbi:hypothetical protein CYLTODRAFT_446099, partial [Cylindrobasidium torrendii FP15055 ss-10]
MSQAQAALSYNAFRDSVPEWVRVEFGELTNVKVRFESLMYGPLNSYCFSVFPPTQEFMVTPQASLRKRHGVGHSLDHNDGLPVPPTSASDKPDQPDIYVQRWIPTHIRESFPEPWGDLRRRFLNICIIEVKRDTIDGQESWHQITRYMTLAGSRQDGHPLASDKPRLKGFLVGPSSFYSFQLVSHKLGAQWVALGETEIGDNGYNLWAQLEELAIGWR